MSARAGFDALQGDAEFLVGSSRVLTMDTDGRTLDGYVHVDRGRIARIVERDATADDPSLADLTRVELDERPLMPGFVDPHVHLEMTSSAMWGTVDCRTPPCASIADMLDALSQSRHLRDARGGWLVGQGGLFADRRFSDQRLPTRDDLDTVSTAHPIAVRFGAHITVLNGVGLERLVEQLERLPSPTGDAHLRVDDNDRYSGVIQELFYALPIPELSTDELTEAMLTTARGYLLEQGVTSIGEITDTMQGVSILSGETGAGRLPLGVRAYVWAPGTASMRSSWDHAHDGEHAALANDRFDVAGVKIFVDGGFSAAGAAVLRPYRGTSGWFGRLAYDKDELTEIIRGCRERDLQVAAHVNGEWAQRLMCEAAIAAEAADAGNALPVRLEHAGNLVTSEETIDWWQRAGVSLVPQAGFVWTLGSFIPDYLGDYARAGLFPFESLRQRGVEFGPSSDVAGAELRQFNPLFGVQCATTRESCIGEILDPGEALSVMDGLRAHTRHAANALGVGDDRGSIEVGKRADLVALDIDPRGVDATKIADVSVAGVLKEGLPVTT
ncbi:amidohydrolase [Egibacter rhizosphaerae]|uniref:Amidohydrolase n=1 Tax=Egibacter rhizosphaerae TaxID=1670831 RepID=A0A411YH10_9ACTN|nr:amidohydrolase family protein [Egibacter rhizosphaerae]QBI20538.1 amidohydrolase [Egibacter rhizosphaerae]